MPEILIIDNFDSFTYNLVDYFEVLGVKCTVCRNNVGLPNILSKRYDGVVLSPGPGTPQKAGGLLAIVEYYHDKLPLLGICLGHQAIGEFFGSVLGKAQKPMHGKVAKAVFVNDPIFNDVPFNDNVVRYHSLILKKPGKNLSVIATSDKNEIMAIRHNDLPIWGIQFHPEAYLTKNGLLILKNWLSINGIIK